MKNNYDHIAPYYDFLSRMVFFRTQVKAQSDQLKFIPANSKVLIVGGGTGWILEEIAKIHPSGLSIVYVEISEKMLNISRKRNTMSNQVEYIHAAAEDFETHQKFDVIITAFLFDNFSGKTILTVFNKLHQLLNAGGYWLFSDFYYNRESGKKWQYYLLKTMYIFFSKISDVEAKMLINTEDIFINHNYNAVEVQHYYAGFIKAIVYQKYKVV
jgi:ubiquinone/menaquinone biosynthesis C-methylase UbiE